MYVVLIDEVLLKVSKLLNELEFILVPVANPDGYAVSYNYAMCI